MDDRRDIGNVLSLDLAAAWVDEPQGGLALRGESLGHFTSATSRRQERLGAAAAG